MKILLVRLDGIGDALVCIPLLAALRAAGHSVAAVLTTKNRDVFAPSALEAIYALERIPWPAHGSTPDSRRQALAAARVQRYDAALIASEEMEAYAFARDAGIPRRTGFTNGWAKPFKTLRVRPLLTEAIARPAVVRRAAEHEVETLFRLGRGLHGDAAPTRDVARLAAFVVAQRPPGHGALVVQAGPKFARYGLDVAAYATLVAGLQARRHQVRVVTEDAAFAQALRRHDAQPEIPATTAHWKALVAGARAVITPDSGAAHVAGMLGVPCVDIFAPSPWAACEIARWRPWAGPFRALVWRDGNRHAAFAERVAGEVEALLGLGGAARTELAR